MYVVNMLFFILQVLMYAEMRGNNQGLIKLISGALKPNDAMTDIVNISNKKISAKVCIIYIV